MKFVKWLLKVVAAIVCLCYFANVFIHRFNDFIIKTSDKTFIVMGDREIETAESDAAALKDIFLGERSAMPSRPSCGFGMDYSVKMTNSKLGILTVWVCPACDKCNVFDIQNTVYEVPDENRRQFEIIVGKYGMTFPAN